MTGISTGQFRRTIEEYFEEHEMDIACRKRRRGYSLYFVDDMPFARLRPTGEEDIVELDWWDGEHWQPVTEFGLALPLVEALDYITDDPDDVFFEADDNDDYGQETISDADVEESVVVDLAVRSSLLLTIRTTVAFSLLGGVCGGIVAGAPWGLLYGAGAALGFCLLYSLIYGLSRAVIGSLAFSGLPSMVLAGASGAVGAAVCQALGGGLWPSVGGALVAVACAFLITVGTWPAWLVGFAAGLTLGISLADSLDIRQQFLGATVIALCAACTATVCRKVGNAVNGALNDHRMLAASGAKGKFVWGRWTPQS